MPREKVIILLPEGFGEHCRGFSSEAQRAYTYTLPADINESWFGEEPSAIVLFSPLIDASLSDWCSAWGLFMRYVAEGIDFFCLPSPRDVSVCGSGVDVIGDLAEETISQRPSLAGRVNFFFPSMDHISDDDLARYLE